MYRALVFTSSILPSQSNPFVDMLEKSSAGVEKQSGVTMVLLNFAQLYRHFKVQRHEFSLLFSTINRSLTETISQSGISTFSRLIFSKVATKFSLQLFKMLVTGSCYKKVVSCKFLDQ